MMLRNYVEECLNIVADALGPIVVEKIPEIDSDDIRALFKAIANEHWNVFRGVVGRNNRPRVYTLLDIAHIISHKKKDTGLDSRQISEMFNSSVFLLKSVSGKEALTKVKSLEQKFNLEMNPKSQDALASFSSQSPRTSHSTKSRSFQLSEKHVEIARYLVNAAKNKETPTYLELWKESWGEQRFIVFVLSNHLDKINDISNKRADVLLSVLVKNNNNKDGTEGLPGIGFFRKAVKRWGNTLNPEDPKSQAEFFAAERKRVYAAAKSDKLDFFTDGETLS